MTAAILLDHVRAYAAAVRSHLADLSPEQVEDLTDGLEADLAEALEDPRGPVATGEIPIGRPAGSLAADVDGASLLDLTQRFGPADEYAAELRSAAGMEPAAPSARRRLAAGTLAGLTAGLRVRLTDRARTVTAPLRRSAAWQASVGFVVALRPLWWVLRGWVVFAVLGRVATLLNPNLVLDRPLVPRSLTGWLVLAGVVAVSIQVGRGLGHARTWSRRTVAVVNVAAVVLVLPTLAALDSAIHHRLESTGAYPVYIEPAVAPAAPENGVVVGGLQVSNLFVYDAAGNPLTGVQIFDDRGRPVRTTYDGGYQAWSLPGVAAPWSFLPNRDEEGRVRWNVYPLSGLPSAQLEQDPLTGLPEPIDGAVPRTPPLPFAKAPAVEATVLAAPSAALSAAPSPTEPPPAP